MITFFSVSTPSISTRSCGTIVLSMSELMPVPRVRNIESISSKNTMTGQPSSLFSRARWNTRRIWRSVSPTYLLRSSGPLMLKKYDLAVSLPGRRGHLLGEAVGHRLGDQRLAAAGRPVEEDALGRRQLVLGEEVLVEERQLHRVGDHLDLVVEAADVVVVDVGHLFEGEVLDLGARQLLEHEARARVEQDGVAVAEPHVAELVEQLDDALLVGAAHDQGAGVVEALLEGDDLAGELGAAGQHHVERLVEDDLRAAVERLVARARGAPPPAPCGRR